MRLPIGLAAVVGVALVGSPGGTPAPAPPRSAGFVRTVDNPWFPVRPGATFVYRGVKDGEPTRDVVHVTRGTRVIGGVRCTAVTDRLYAAGHLAERTTDWYAQDRAGTVWYFGEDTAELDAAGKVTSREGSWLSGVNGARAGVFMPAHPRVGQAFRQEYLKGHAEDNARNMSVDEQLTVPQGHYDHVFMTRETTPLEPKVLEYKFYARGVGPLLAISVSPDLSFERLVSFKRGA